MRTGKFFVFLFIIFAGILRPPEIPGNSPEDDDPDNYGILEGQIIDEETNKLVYEKFFVSISNSDIENQMHMGRFGTETDENGFFSCKWRPGTYLIYFSPRSRTSKYCWDINPFNYPGEKQIVKIERGKVTTIIKKARLAGRLKLIMVSREGEPINPGEIVGDNAHCSVRFFADRLIFSISGKQFTEGDDFNDGEILVHCLTPDEYELKIKFDGLGVGSLYMKNIEVKKKETTEVKIPVDLNNPTGIQGNVLYKNGEPIEGLRVSVGGPEGDPDTIVGSFYTDANGFYRIVSLKEGIYDIDFDKNLGGSTYLFIRTKKVIVKNGSLSRFDLRVKNPDK